MHWGLLSSSSADGLAQTWSHLHKKAGDFFSHLLSHVANICWVLQGEGPAQPLSLGRLPSPLLQALPPASTHLVRRVLRHGCWLSSTPWSKMRLRNAIHDQCERAQEKCSGRAVRCFGLPLSWTPRSCPITGIVVLMYEISCILRNNWGLKRLVLCWLYLSVLIILEIKAKIFINSLKNNNTLLACLHK